jgi:hypothetical protein
MTSAEFLQILGRLVLAIIAIGFLSIGIGFTLGHVRLWWIRRSIRRMR